jgi:gamma-glutamyltranspeptidase/glutathione hydrolase
MLNMLESFDLDRQGRWSTDTLHLLVESMRRAYLDRARFLGDSDYVQIPAELTSKDYARRLAAQIDRRRATSSEALARSADLPLAAEGTETTHFSIVDSHGMAVSNTYTLEHSYGSRVVVRGAGFLLNNEMGDFNWKPGYTDRQGNIGTPANAIAPDKRMLSSQTPVLVTRDGRIFLVAGSPGGRTIINTSLQIILNVIEFEMDLPAAVAAPRLHHQWFPDVVRIEQSMLRQQSGVIEQLRQMGHTVETSPYQGDAHCILVDGEGRLLGVADDRISGSAAGW